MELDTRPNKCLSQHLKHSGQGKRDIFDIYHKAGRVEVSSAIESFPKYGYMYAKVEIRPSFEKRVDHKEALKIKKLMKKFNAEGMLEAKAGEFIFLPNLLYIRR